MRTHDSILVAFLVSFAAVAGCTTTGGGPRGCPGQGAACSPVSGCCTGYDCVNGFCVGTTSSGDMAQSSNPDLAMTSCKNAGDVCTSPSDCCSPNTCTNGVCAAASTRKSFGSPCSVDTDCLSNACLGYQGASGRFCSQPCSNSPTCTALSASPVYWCLPASGGSFCAPTCVTSAECTHIGPDWSCRNSLSSEGTLKAFCGVWGQQGTCAPCQDDSQCSSGTCNSVWCQQTCTASTDCGAAGKCVQAGDMNYYCFPTCTGNATCAIYAATATCDSATDKGGATVKICNVH